MTAVICSRVVRTAAKEKLSKVFDCPFCNHTGCVETRMQSNRGTGSLVCRVCQASYTTATNSLTEPVDIYAEWIDRCEEENGREETAEPQTFEEDQEAYDEEDDFLGEEAEEVLEGMED